jgi:hypothetical protein
VSSFPTIITGSGPIRIGTNSLIDRAFGEFEVRYARGNELDYEAFVTEIRERRQEKAEVQ